MIHYVYEMYADDGTCLYVGCTNNIGKRLTEHSIRPWWPEVSEIQSRMYPTIQEGRAAEKRRIQHLQPIHNITFTDARRIHIRRITPVKGKGYVASKVQAEMVRQYVNQSQIATAVGISRPALFRRLEDQRLWTYDEIERLADLFGMTVKEFMS